MSKNKSLSEQLTELQQTASLANEYQKLFDKACQINFHMSAKALQKMLSEKPHSGSDFEHQLCSYFDLQSSFDREEFLSIMCSENSKNYFQSRRKNEPAEKG